MVRFILAGNYTEPPDVGSVEADGSCLYCGERALEATLQDQFFIVRCTACDRPGFSYRVRPAQARAHAGTALVEAVIWEQVGDFLKIGQGVCPDCAGRVETEVRDTDDVPTNEDVPIAFATISECQQCLRLFSLPLTHFAAYHPESVAFHWDHGVDIMGTGMWELHRYVKDGQWTAERAGGDPEEYRVELRRDAASLRLYLDGNAAVTRTERVQSRDRSDRRS